MLAAGKGGLLAMEGTKGVQYWYKNDGRWTGVPIRGQLIAVAVSGDLRVPAPARVTPKDSARKMR